MAQNNDSTKYSPAEIDSAMTYIILMLEQEGYVDTVKRAEMVRDYIATLRAERDALSKHWIPNESGRVKIKATGQIGYAAASYSLMRGGVSSLVYNADGDCLGTFDTNELSQIDKFDPAE